MTKRKKKRSILIMLVNVNYLPNDIAQIVETHLWEMMSLDGFMGPYYRYIMLLLVSLSVSLSFMWSDRRQDILWMTDQFSLCPDNQFFFFFE